MKKFLVALLVLAMVFSMTTFAFAVNASDSTSTSTGGADDLILTADEGDAKDAAGNSYIVLIDLLPYYDPAAQQIREAEGTEDLVEKIELTDEAIAALAGSGYAVEDLTALTPWDITVKGSAAGITWPLTIKLPVPGAKVGKTAVVLHKGTNGWEVVPSEIKVDDEVEATFSNLSPVLVLLATGEPTNTYNTCAKGEECPLNAYTDLDVDAWYHDYVHYVLDKNLMEGYGETFGPQDNVRRGDVLTVLHRFAGSPSGIEDASFDDLADALDYMVPAINWAAKEGLVEGNDGKILATDAITRQELFVIFARYAEKLGKKTGTYAVSLADFADVADVADWALDAITWGVASGLIEGNEGNLFPQDNATRAEFATLITRWVTEITK
jgi:hypothetical protein